MKRKIIALISVLALSFSVFAFSVSAVEGEESGGEIIETEPAPEPEPTYAVSYTHLTLPTIYSV